MMAKSPFNSSSRATPRASFGPVAMAEAERRRAMVDSDETERPIAAGATERSFGILDGIERTSWLVARKAMAICKMRIVLLQVPGVPQQDLADVGGCLTTQDIVPEPAFDQHG